MSRPNRDRRRDDRVSVSDPGRSPDETDDQHDQTGQRHGDHLVTDSGHERHFDVGIDFKIDVSNILVESQEKLKKLKKLFDDKTLQGYVIDT